jgi:hypothetical protein
MTGARHKKWTNVRPQSEPRPGYPLGRERFAATHLANAPSRGALWARLCLKYSVRQDFLDWRAVPGIASLSSRAPADDLVFPRSSSAQDQPPDWYAMLLETLQDPCVEGGAFEGGEEFIFRSVRQPPPERDTAEFGVHQDASVPVVVKQNDSLARHIYIWARAVTLRLVGHRETCALLRCLLGTNESCCVRTTTSRPSQSWKPEKRVDPRCPQSRNIHRTIYCQWPSTRT